MSGSNNNQIPTIYDVAREAGMLGVFLLTNRMEVHDIAMIRLIRDANQMAAT